jgi:hypothetical protein
MTTPHKHAEVLRAIADGKEVQFSHMHTTTWHDMKAGGIGYDPLTNESWNWRVKPEPKPDFVNYFNCYDNCIGVFYQTTSDLPLGSDAVGRIKVTFCGETGKLKSAEVV